MEYVKYGFSFSGVLSFLLNCVAVNNYNPAVYLFTITLFLIVLKVTCKPEKPEGFCVFLSFSAKYDLHLHGGNHIYFFLSLEVWIEVQRTTVMIILGKVWFPTFLSQVIFFFKSHQCQGF